MASFQFGIEGAYSEGMVQCACINGKVSSVWVRNKISLCAGSCHSIHPTAYCGAADPDSYSENAEALVYCEKDRSTVCLTVCFIEHLQNSKAACFAAVCLGLLQFMAKFPVFIAQSTYPAFEEQDEREQAKR